ncbi:sensor histidine kinase [Paenibacillus abyssi]|uniref:Histidine kinase n=1 Tax=Paenibacillus abyssi TaxID=1340531 RepID=A0A917LH06_9BACL|nr:sensor histidine kinase [Paenibacillus abyssi]GGG22941.1 histidine kinase [Paenibacillus abyssi]
MMRKLVNRIFNMRSMQYQLLLTYLLINLVPLIIVGSLSYRVAADLITREAMQNNDLLLQSINRNVNSYLKEIYDQSDIFTALIIKNAAADGTSSIHADLSDPVNLAYLSTYMKDLLDNDEEYISIRIFSDDGQLISYARNADTYNHKYNSPEELTWQQLMKDNDGDDLIFDMHTFEVNGIYSFTASRAIIHPVSGERLGYISYDKSLSSFASYFREIEYRSGGIMQIVRNNDTYLYHSNHARIGKPVDDSIRSRLETIRADSFVAEMNGKDIIFSYNTLMNSGLAVVGSVPMSELTEGLQSLRDITLAVSILSLILVFLLSYYLSIYMTRPIQRLNSLMTRVESGNFNIGREKMGNTNREIHQLNNSFHSMVTRINQLIKIQYETELHKKDAELKALLMQINPHFLYNTLEVINGIADYEGVEQISEITQSLSKMLRYNIDLSRDQVALADELENSRNFVLILKSRFEDQLDVQWDIDDTILHCKIAKMVLQPLLENSIKHGVEKKLGKGFIRISANRNGERVEIRIADNGAGFSADKLSDFERYKRMSGHSYFDMSASSNLGLKNVFNRLRIVFGEELIFDIVSEEHEGTTVIINIPGIDYK